MLSLVNQLAFRQVCERIVHDLVRIEVQLQVCNTVVGVDGEVVLLACGSHLVLSGNSNDEAFDALAIVLCHLKALVAFIDTGSNLELPLSIEVEPVVRIHVQLS